MKIKTDFLLPAALVLFTGNSYALELLFEPDFSFKERYDDNLRMQIKPRRTNLISTLSPGVLFGYLADDNELKTRFKWNELIYHGDSALDFSEKLVNVNHMFRSELFKTDLTAGYSEESSINNQLDPAQINELGGIQILVPRTTKSVAPSITYNLNETNALQLGYNYVDVAYDRQASLASNRYYSDYSNQQFSATLTHVYSERLSFNLTGAYSEFDSPSEQRGLGLVQRVLAPNGASVTLRPEFQFGAPGNTHFSQIQRTLFYQLGLQYALCEQMQLSLAAGIRNINSDFNSRTTFDDPSFLPTESSQSSSTSGNVYSASLIRNFERGNLSLSASQQLNPASTGTQQQTTLFSASARYNLTDRWNTGINASYQMSESVTNFNGNNASNNRTYTTLTPNIQWRWTPEINLDLSYSYRQQQYESTNQTAIGNSVQLQFSYQPQINRQVK
ncbi:hypothetical protein QZJ86_13515 [Methylomonas montana]|uniref:hypothetical protein n=1 Tax=Methylomonas montana TaxID=3058963 RepID=UPI00265A81F5|nr:hypothetical protein [Methylomonas montana]WKJ89040.1 hypothetical protein QZJ86_13515 [Methylomonas montana]